MTDKSALHYFIGAYFHEDYIDEHGSARGAVNDFATEDYQQAALVPAEISNLLALKQAEPQLEATLVAYGLVYDPIAKDWPSHREWLLDVARQIDSRLGRDSGGIMGE